MSNKTVCALMFLSGLSIGASVMWLTLKTKYEQMAREEIDAVKDVYYKKKDTAAQNADIIENQGYVDGDIPTREETKNEEEDDDMPKPYVIPPDEFDTLGYDVTSLDYYADGVLIDETGVMIDDEEIEDLIGDALEHFGEYEDDSVFVRDDILKTDYEILRDTRQFYSDVFPSEDE